LLGDAVLLPERAALLESEWYRDGLFEVQDAGSQLIGLACGVHPGMDVLDACAGGGGKTMHLADMMHDQGTITACDIERSKLRGLSQRAQRLGLRSVQTMAVTTDGDFLDDSSSFPYASFDCVLVDAPCSGFGTVRRNPAHKWRLSEKTVKRLADRQAAILARFAEAVRPGGTLVYATCSLLPHENSAIVAEFLSSRPDFSLALLAPSFDTAGLNTDFLSPSASELLVLPDIFDSDGFYIAKFLKNDR
jgi:16S rRNA (cytosine967-C5)-methyltransferase